MYIVMCENNYSSNFLQIVGTDLNGWTTVVFLCVSEQMNIFWKSYNYKTNIKVCVLVQQWENDECMHDICTQLFFVKNKFIGHIWQL